MRKLLSWTLVICVLLAACTPAFAAANQPAFDTAAQPAAPMAAQPYAKPAGQPACRVVVATDGSGQYTCDGVDDQIEINAALSAVEADPDLTTIYLRSGTYVIDAPLLIGNDTMLTGDPDTVLTIRDGAIWPINQAMIQQKDATGNQGIRIRGFTIDGNSLNITQGINARQQIVTVKGGQSYYSLISLRLCQDIRVERMTLTNNHNDGLLLNRCSQIVFNDNFVDRIGHDGLYANYCTEIQARRNRIKVRINSGLRLYQSNHAVFSENVISSAGEGGSGIEIPKYGNGYAMDDILIRDNLIYDTVLAGIWIFGGMAQPYPPETAFVHIQGNRIIHTGTRASGTMVGGIVANGFNLHINRNQILDCYDAAIAIRNTLYPTSGGPYAVKINNNRLLGTIPVSGEAGWPILNTMPDLYQVAAVNNRIP